MSHSVKGSNATPKENWRLLQLPPTVTMPDAHLLRLIHHFNDEHPGYLHTVLDHIIINGFDDLDEEERTTLRDFLFMLREMDYAYHLNDDQDV